MKTGEEAKSASRGESRDMSPEAISRRFDILVELDRVARALGAARRRPATTTDTTSDPPAETPGEAAQSVPTNAGKGADRA